MSTYQDVIAAQGAVAAWALTEAAGLSFAPYIGGQPLVGSGTFAYRQAGPFASAFGLQINVGGKLGLPFVAPVNVPVSFECWYKLALPLAAAQYLYYNGNAGANGNGIYVKNTDAHLHYFAGGGIIDKDLGVLWPDSAWHHFVSGVDTNQALTFYLDGVTLFRGLLNSPLAPNPNELFIGADSSTSSATVVAIATPAYYIKALTPAQAANDFLASTDPSTALSNTMGSSGDLLTSIWNAVHKVY